MKGYPEQIQVLAGKNKITLKYQHNLNQTLFGAMLNSGAIGGSITESLRDKHIFELDLKLTAGHEYIIMFNPNLKSGDNSFPKPWVVDKSTTQVVYGVLPTGVSNATPIN